MSDAVIMGIVTAFTTVALALISAMKPPRQVTNTTTRTPASPQLTRLIVPPSQQKTG